MIYKHIALGFYLILSNVLSSQTLFNDDFEGDLKQWEHQENGIAQLIKTEDPKHKSVLQLTPNKSSENVLIKGSDIWEGVVIKGEALFPTDEHDYLGLIYNYHEADRTDFGCIYIKGKGSYIRVNPHRDGNASRALYEEYKTPLIDEAEIKKNQWFSFKAEIIGSECHFYVADMDKPKVIFKYFEYSKGKIGFKPRLVGGEVWLDNIIVEQIDDFNYSGSTDTYEIPYCKDMLLNDWQAMGPLSKRIKVIEESETHIPLVIEEQAQIKWSDFTTDERGCVLAGTLCRYATDQKLAYFSTKVDFDQNIQTEIQFSSLNNLQVWVNSKYVGTIEKQRHAWFDFYKNPEHAGQKLSIDLKKGTNTILVLVEGGNYSGDGFYAYIDK